MKDARLWNSGIFVGRGPGTGTYSSQNISVMGQERSDDICTVIVAIETDLLQGTGLDPAFDAFADLAKQSQRAAVTCMGS